MAESLSANRQRLRIWRAENPDLNRKKNAEYRRANPEKAVAHKKVEVAIRSGALTRQACERCGTDLGVQAHHEDYRAPLAVNWLCPMHHRQRHREIDGLPEPTGRREHPVRQARLSTDYGKGITHADGCFRVRLTVLGKTKGFGSFSTLEEAIAARDATLVTIAIHPAIPATKPHRVQCSESGAGKCTTVGDFSATIGASA